MPDVSETWALQSLVNGVGVYRVRSPRWEGNTCAVADPQACLSVAGGKMISYPFILCSLTCPPTL